MASWVRDDVFALAIAEVRDLPGVPALGQVQQRAFTFAEAQVIDLREVPEQRRANRRDMHITEHDLDVGTLRLNPRGDLDGVHEARGRHRKTDHVRTGRQYDLGIGVNRGGRGGAEAIVYGAGLPMPFQPGRQLQDAQRRHAVRQQREIRLAGNKIESGRMNERDSHV